MGIFHTVRGVLAFQRNGRIEWRLVGFIWIYCIIWFMIQDVFKVGAYILLSRAHILLGGAEVEKQARKKKLEQRASVRVMTSLKLGAPGSSQEKTLTIPEVMSRISAL